MDVITVNDTYDLKTLEFWKKHGVVYPELNHVDQIIDVVKHTNGKVGVRLAGIENPKVPIVHPILGTQMLNVTFAIERFRNLSGSIINYEEIKNNKTIEI